MLDANSAEFLSGIVADKINLLTGIDVKKIDCDNNQVNGVLLSNNEKIECQLVIITKGVTPNTQLAKDAGLTVNWGIVVDNTMKTSAEDIYAAGDAAETLDLLTGERDIKALWTTAIDQGTVAGKNMAAEHTLYDGAVSMNSIDCFGIPCIAAGNLRRDFSDVYDFRSTDPLILRRIFVNRNRIHGFVAAGDLRFAGILNNLLKEKRDISTIKDKLGSATLTRADLLECLDEKETVSLMKKGN